VTSRSRAGPYLGGTLLVGVLAFGPASAGGAAGGGVCEGVVVDQGSAASVTAQGANVAPGTSDLQALSTVNEPPTQNSSGLVCAINSYPPDGLQNCLATSGGGYDYWSYWQGDPYANTWTYAAVGPASHTVASGQTYVEGWRYQNPGPDNPSAPKPSVTPAAAFAQACPGVTPGPEASSGGGGSGGSSGGGGSGGAGGGSSPPPASSTSTTTPVGSGSQPASRPTVAGGGMPGTTTTTHPGSTGAGVPANASAPTTTTTARTRTAPRSAAEKAAVAAAHHGSSGGGDPVLPIVLVGLIIAALAGLACWRWRSRPMEE
jgi:hypothetical protein